MQQQQHHHRRDEAKEEENMELFVETLTGTAFELRVSPFETIVSVKAKIQRLEGIPVAQQHLVWQSKELEDEYCLQDYRISDGATIKLVLAMRGGPINTRRIALEDPTWREMVEYMETNREDIWEKLPGGKQVTLLVFRDGDQINFFRVIDRADGSLSPLAETLSNSSVKVLNEEQDAAAQERFVENAVTLQKMKQLRKKMEALNLKKKPRRTKVQGQNNNRPGSRTSSHHVLVAKPKIQNTGFSLNKHFRLPPVNSHYLPSTSKQQLDLNNVEGDATSKTDAAIGDASASLSGFPPSESPDHLLTLENNISVDETGAVPKQGHHSGNRSHVASSSTNSQSPSLTALEAYRRSLMQLRTNVSRPNIDPRFIRDHSYLSDVSTSLAKPAHSEAKPSCISLPALNHVHDVLAKLDPRISAATTGIHNSRVPTVNRRERLLLSSSVGLPPQHKLLEELQQPVGSFVNYRPKTSPEKWDRATSDVNATTQELSQATRDICEILNRTRTKLKSQGSLAIGHKERLRRQSRSIDPDLVLASEFTSHLATKEKQPIDGLDHLIASETHKHHGESAALLIEDKAVAQEFTIKASRLQRISNQGRLTSAQKLPPVKIMSTVATNIIPRCKVCNKKTGLATSYTCRCGQNFCAIHRYAETHSCTFDYKTEGRRLLEQANPMVAAPKLPKI